MVIISSNFRTGNPISFSPFKLSKNTEILARYKKMAQEDRDYAEYFYDMLVENGVDAGDRLSDTEFKRLIRKQYYKVKSIADDGFY
jgi:hypothetical protein